LASLNGSCAWYGTTADQEATCGSPIPRKIVRGVIGGACSMHGNYENAYKILVENPEGRRYLEDLDVDGRIILECILGK